MATTEEILTAARNLGDLIAQHEATRKFEAAAQALEEDMDAQRTLTDYQRTMTTVVEKERQGRPIEVADKRQLEDLQSKVVRNTTLQKFQIAQMDYVDLMRQVQEAMQSEAEPETPAAAQSPIMGPGGLGGT